jgi:uncharacterized Zn-binding protein involved in type VI secretion
LRFRKIELTSSARLKFFLGEDDLAMVLRRYHIRAGATTTAGGVVKASSDWNKLNGIPLAREGDPVDCPTCGGQGVIKCVMPRLTERFQGKEYALSDDLCVCGCHPPPKLIADQNCKYQTIIFASEESAETPGTTGPQHDKAGAQSAHSPKTAPSPGESATKADVRQSLRLVERETGKPHANRPYRLDLPGGKVVQGTTDADGRTKPLTQDERAALRSWQAGGQ